MPLYTLTIPVEIDLEPEKLRSAPLELINSEVVRALGNKDKQELLIGLLELAEDGLWSIPATIIELSDGRRERFKQKLEKVEIIGDVQQTNEFNYTYYEKGPIDVILVTERDADDIVILQYEIKHYLDGRQPSKHVIVP